MATREGTMKRLFAALVLALASVGGAHPAPAAAADRSPAAEIFATSNTAIITDPNDPRLDTRLVAFERQVDAIVRRRGSEGEAPPLLAGGFWASTPPRGPDQRSPQFPRGDIAPTHL